MDKNKQNFIENIKMIKKVLMWGDFNVIVNNIKEQHGITYSRSAVASCLSPANDYFNPLIYAEALKLSVKRQESKYDLEELERSLKELSHE